MIDCLVPQLAKAIVDMEFSLEQLIDHPVLSSRLDNLHREGSRLRATCPNCKGSDRSFYTGPTVNFLSWNCHSCGHTVPTVVLLGLSWSTEPRPAVKDWQDPEPDPEGIVRTRNVYGALIDFAQYQLKRTDHVLAYLAGRGIDADRARAFGLGYLDAQSYIDWFNRALSPAERDAAVDLAGLPDAAGKTRLSGFGAMFAGGYQGKIVFPYFDRDGQVVDIRTRSISPKDTIRRQVVRYTSPKGGQLDRGAVVPYGVDTLGDAGRVILSEGEFKRLTPMSAGLPYPVLSLRGTGDPVDVYLDHFRGRLVVLAFDNDDRADRKTGLTAGQMATIRVGRVLSANQIDVVVLDPAVLRDQKGIDDFVRAYGVDAFAQLVAPGQCLTLAEYEGRLSLAGGDLSGLVRPKRDPGTVRQWRPEDHVDDIVHTDGDTTVDVDQASDLLYSAFRHHFGDWKRGNRQLLSTAQAGVGKTTQAVRAAREIVETGETEKTIAVFLPNHDTIDEKIKDGTLDGFRHIYGRRWDPYPDGKEAEPDDWSDDPADGIRNCTQADVAQNLTKYGYSPGAILCPTCPVQSWCKQLGYKSQFVGKTNRAYVHAHLFSDYPESEDLAIVDELTHKTFIDDMVLWQGDILAPIERSPALSPAQRDLLSALLQLYTTPNLGDLGGAVFYDVLRRHYPGLDDVDAWGDGSLVQGVLDGIARDFSAQSSTASYEAEELPTQFGAKLFAVMSDDVRRQLAGKPPTGRLRLVTGPSPDSPRRLVLVYSRGRLPKWFANRPTVVLNATGDDTVLDDLVGPFDVVSPLVAVQDGNQVIQDITRNNAKSGLMGDSRDAQGRRDAWRRQVQSHVDGHPGGESDTTIITTKSLVKYAQDFWPTAKIAHYGALEGRNDLQSGLTILANSPPVNLQAVQLEAIALWPGIDTTLTRTAVAFDEQNAGGEFLAVEQIDAVDPRVRSLLWQHRDALVVQAVQRARLVRNTGRTVVALFARPIPGLRPTRIVRERPSPSTVAAEKRQRTIDALIRSAQDLITRDGAFSLSTLTATANVSRKTAWKYWPDVTSALGLKWIDLPVLQPLANGATKRVAMRVAVSAEIGAQLTRSPNVHDVSARYRTNPITLGNVVHFLLPDGWTLDLPTLPDLPMDPPATAETTPESVPVDLPDVDDEVLDALEGVLVGAERGDTLSLATVRNALSLWQRSGLTRVVRLVAKQPDDGPRGWGRQDWTLDGAGDGLRLIRQLRTQAESVAVERGQSWRKN